MTVLLPAIVPGLNHPDWFHCRENFDAGEPNAFWAAIYILSPALITDLYRTFCLKHRGFSYRIRDYLFAALPGVVLGMGKTLNLTPLIQKKA